MKRRSYERSEEERIQQLRLHLKSRIKSEKRQDSWLDSTGSVGIMEESFRSYMLFFAFQCISNALFLILYGVQAFTEHELCMLPPEGRNIAAYFNFTFLVGFGLHSAIFVNATYIDLSCRVGTVWVQGSLLPISGVKKAATRSTTLLAFVSEYFEWVSHLATFFLSILACAVVLSVDG